MVKVPKLPNSLNDLLQALETEFTSQESSAWNDHVTNGWYGGYYLLKNGQLDYDEQHDDGLTSTELTLLYCHHLFPPHLAVALRACRSKLKPILNDEHLKGERIVLLDIGAGPLTFGLALYFDVLLKNEAHPDFHYVAVDTSAAMRSRAIEVSRLCGKPWNLYTKRNLNQGVNKAISLLTDDTYLVVAASYVFAQHTLQVAQTAASLTRLFKGAASDYISLVASNPSRYQKPLNIDKWPKILQEVGKELPNSEQTARTHGVMPRPNIRWQSRSGGQPMRYYSQRYNPLTGNIVEDEDD